MKNEFAIVPADFTFQHFKYLEESKPDDVQTLRIGEPARGKGNKLATKAVWLNNNRLQSIKSIEIFMDSILEYPQNLMWLDLSFNRLKEIDVAILKFPLLSILNLHGNKISEVKEIIKLKSLKFLRSITIHGNPVYFKKNYRMFVISSFPQISSLDFTRITDKERKLATALDRKVD